MYVAILNICEEVSKYADIKESICIFVIHQFRNDMEETRKIITDLDLEISEKQLQTSLFQPFSGKSLKDEYNYLILKIRDYSMHTISNDKFNTLHLDDENKKKEFINRCFFSNIEKLAGKLDEIEGKFKDLFYLVIMKVSIHFI